MSTSATEHRLIAPELNMWSWLDPYYALNGTTIEDGAEVEAKRASEVADW